MGANTQQGPLESEQKTTSEQTEKGRAGKVTPTLF